MLEHVGLVGQGKRAPFGRRPGEGRFQQASDGRFRVDGQVHPAAGFRRTLQAIGALRVLPEDLDVEGRGLPRSRGPAGAEIDRQIQALPQSQEDLLCVPPIGNARIPHGAEENGVAAVTEVPEGCFSKGFPGGKEMVRAIGQRQHLQPSSPSLGPVQEGSGFGHDFRTDAIAGDEGHANGFVQLSSFT